MLTPRTSSLIADVQFTPVAVLTNLGHLYERVAYSPYARAEHRWAGDVDADGDVDNPDAQAVAGAIGATIGGANGISFAHDAE